MSKVCAVGIKKLFYTDPNKIVAPTSGAYTSAMLKTLLTGADKPKSVTNIHQDTWTLEEAEASQDVFRNQLTGGVYRTGRKTMGDITVNWTIGQYDYDLKAEFLGGIVSEDGKSWERPRGITEKHLALIAVTEDDQYVLLPYCSIKAREANTDGAIGLGITGNVLEPENDKLSSEYWFDNVLA